MKILVLNLRGIKYTFTFIKWVAVFLLISLVTLFFHDKYVSSASYVDAMVELSTEKVIIIDAGHGGEDPGTIGYDGTYEKDINLLVSNDIGDLLVEKGYAVVYTRTEDKLLYTEKENVKGIRKISDLKNRCKIAADYPESVFVSIHMNSYQSTNCKGLQVYYSTKNENSKNLASLIQSNVKSSLQNDNNRVPKTGKGLYLMENIENTAVIVECGFISNPEECTKLSEKEYRKQLSLAIVCGIIEYIENNYK